MKEFLQLMRRFVSPYKKYIGWAILLNILSAVFNVFSFTFLIPILSILFKTEGADKVYHFMEWGSGDLADVAKNNFYYYISQMIVDNGPTVALIFLGLFLMVMTLFKTGCYFASSAVMIPLRTGVVRDIRIMVYAKVMRLPMSFFSEERKGDIIARMSGDVGEVENSITSSLDMLMKSPILIIIYFVTLVTVSWQLTLFTIIVLPGMGWLMGVVGRKLKRQSLEAQAKWSDTMSQLEETLGGLRIIKAFIAEDKMINRFTKCSNELRDATNKVAIRQAMAHPMSEFLGTILIVAVLWFGGTLILGKIPKGKTIALVGQSGSGKSTLVDLLPRYHDVQEGDITIDGTSIRDVRIADLRSLIGNVNQEAILFNDTFFNNIAFGVENATMEQVVEAAKIANAHDFIMEKPEGYNMNIGDRGGKLSGGQRQRISIARAILKNPPILILDEATSALDTESERLVQEALERLMKTRTTIAIAHRLSTIKNADEICVLYEGEIVERGKHEELIELNGYYKRLHDMQQL